MFSMSQKEYCSAEYFAQELRNYINDNFLKNFGFIPNVRQSGGTVRFCIGGVECLVCFNKGGAVGNNLHVSIEAERDEQTLGSAERRIRVIRSQKGKVSQKTYEILFDNFVFPYLKSLKDSI